MIKVLQLLPSINIGCGDFGVIFNYYRSIDKSKIQFDFGYINDVRETEKREIEFLGGKIFKLNVPSLKYGAKKFIEDLKDILKNNQYDIIHLNMPTFHRFVKKAIKGLNIKLIVHAHATKLAETKVKSLRNRILKMGINKKVDYRFACSIQAGQKWFGKDFSKKSKDIFLKNAINFSKFKFDSKVREEVRADLGLQDDENAICHIGRFVNVKIDFPIEIFRQLCYTGDQRNRAG